MELYSWNVNGVRAAQRKGLLEWIEQTDPDVLCLQETKAAPEQLDDVLRSPPGYYGYWACAERKGYSGVAMFAKQEPLDLHLGLGIPEFDREGRTIVADFGSFVLITAYIPNGSRDHSRVPFKLAYCDAFLDFCNDLQKDGRTVVFCGDVNTAHKEIDIARPKQNQNSTGFLPEERAWIDRVIDAG
jgi:exodeoxyribonuclease-3